MKETGLWTGDMVMGYFVVQMELCMMYVRDNFIAIKLARNRCLHLCIMIIIGTVEE